MSDEANREALARAQEKLNATAHMVARTEASMAKLRELVLADEAKARRWHLFAGDTYYPSGGLNDWRGSYDNEGAALAIGENLLSGGREWCQIAAVDGRGHFLEPRLSNYEHDHDGEAPEGHRHWSADPDHGHPEGFDGDA